MSSIKDLVSSKCYSKTFARRRM